MKQSEFNAALIQRLVLLKAGIIFTAQRELAYAGNNWASMISTVFYTVSVLVFLKVIYANVQTVAGYSYNEMLFYFFVSQMTYYANWIITVRNLNDLIPDVNKGNLDMILIKPVPTLYFLMTRTVSLVLIITDAIPVFLAILFSINWHTLPITPTHLFVGLIVWVCGLITLHVFQLLAALPVFWFGESQNILDLAGATAAAAGTTIPFEGYSHTLQKLLGTLVPVLIATGFTTSILLGKSNPLLLLGWACIIAVLAIFIRNIAWQFALKHYTSASS